MEIIKLNTVGYYFYCPDLQIENYDKHLSKKKLLNECTICKRFILEPSYDSITNNRNIVHESDITIGKCGHMYHSDCINSWLKTNNICPIDKVAWQTFRVADSFTKLVLKEDKFDKTSNSKFVSHNKNNNFDNQVNKFYPKKYNKMIEPVKTMKKFAGNYPGEAGPNVMDVEQFMQNKIPAVVPKHLYFQNDEDEYDDEDDVVAEVNAYIENVG